MRKRLVVGVLGAVLSVTTSGCFLRSIFSIVIVASDLGELVDEVITTVFSDSTAAVCTSTDFGYHECIYIIDGVEVASTAYLLAELGLAGILIDPLLLELPANVTDIAAAFDDGAGHSGALVVRAGLATVPADQSQSFTAGAGKQLVIVELPDGAPVTGDFDMRITFKQTVPLGTGGPVPMKTVLTGKVTVFGNVFYPPLLPCTTDLTTVPETTLPVSAASIPVALPAAPTDCTNKVYNYGAVLPQLTATPTPTPTATPVAAAVGAMHCYAVKTAKGNAKFVPVSDEQVVDPGFNETTRFTVTKPVDLCAPASVNGSAVADFKTHLERYVVRPAKNEPKHPKHGGLVFTNVLGTITIDAAAAGLLMVQTNADRTNQVPGPDPSTNDIDHYLCYAAKTSKGTPKVAKGLEVSVADQLATPARRYALRKITRLCAPVEKNGEAIAHAADHLLCYQARAAKKRCSFAAPTNAGGGCKQEVDCGGVDNQTKLCDKQPKLAATRGLSTANQFGSTTLDAVKEGEVCLPSQRQ